MWKIALVGVGGATGSILRYLVTLAVQSSPGTRFPWGILLVNVTGCLLIGFLGMMLARQSQLRWEEYYLLLVVGVLGGFTTFSSFAGDTLRLAREDQLFLAGANVLANNVLGLLAAWVGYRAALLLWPVTSGG